jgi:prephenate dehydrogenase
MTKPRVTIIGLGLIGGSIGLGLKAATDAVHIVGHDIDFRRNRLAKNKGAVDESTGYLLDACDDADVVILAIPITAIRETLEVIGPHLKQGCVVTDTAKLKERVLAWAAETLPAGVPFVGGNPLLNPNAQPKDPTTTDGLELARADLFENALYALCPSAETHPTGVKRVTDVINLLNARVFYVDPVEHDGMQAAVEGLPVMTSFALMMHASGSPGWKEARKLADHVLGVVTEPLTVDPALLRAQMLLNADHLLPRIDAFMRELVRLRELIAGNNTEALDEALDKATSERARWFADWEAGKWDEEPAGLAAAGSFGSLGDMLGLGLVKRKRKDE